MSFGMSLSPFMFDFCDLKKRYRRVDGEYIVLSSQQAVLNCITVWYTDYI